MSVRTVARLLLASVLLVAFACTSQAQTTGRRNIFGHYQQFSWQDQDGLPHNAVLAITTTRDGYLWLGTYEGAARFDGVRFTVFNPANTSALGNALVTSLLEDRAGHLWLGTFGGGLTRLAEGRFTQYTTRDGLASDYVTRLFEDRTGTLWIGTGGAGLTSLRDGRFTSYTAADGLPSSAVWAFAEDGHGGVLAGTNTGIARIEGGRVEVYRADAEIARAKVYSLATSPDGALWVGAPDSGLYRIDSRGTTRFAPSQGLTRDRVESLHVSADGNVWVGTETGGLLRYSDGRFERYSTADGLPGDRVPIIAQGADSDLWIGTSGGLVRLKAPRFTVYTERDGLANDRAGDVYQDAEGSVWIASSSGLTRFKDGVFKVFTTRDGLPTNPVRAIARDTTGLIWVLTRAGLSRWHDGRFVKSPDVPELEWGRVSSLLQDRSGALWFTIETGVARVSHGRVTYFTKKDGLADDSTLKLFEDRAGSIWVATVRGGITRISGSQLTSWSARDGLAANHVKSFYEESPGVLWIGTHGGGLSRFKDGRFANVSMRQGLYNDTVFQILEGDDGNLWMNCNRGIWRTSLKELNAVADGSQAAVSSFAYGVADGMLSSEGVGAAIAGWKVRDGSLWFPTINGVVVIDPGRRDAVPPRVVIEGLTVDREPMPADRAVRLRPSQQNLEIQYTALNWSRPREVRFKFRMEGLDRDWVDAGGRRTSYYSHMPPGSYTFTVIADNGEGVWDTTGRSVAVVVLPHFYQTWWFQSAMATFVVALAWLAWQRRAAELQRAQADQQAFSRQLIESQERERQRIAAELHDSLGQSLILVRNRALLGAISQPDEAIEQCEEIGATVAQALDEVRAIAYNLRPYHLDRLGLTATIKQVVEKTGESCAIRLTGEIDDVDGVFAPADEITIYRIVQESLNNLVKHSRATTATVTVRCGERDVEIRVQDDGQGFPVNALTAEASRRGGFGLTGLAERVHMLGGSHVIESRPGRGTTVVVTIGRRARDGEAPSASVPSRL